MGSRKPHVAKCNCNMIFERELTNIRLLRPYWPQTASKLGDKFQIRVGLYLPNLDYMTIYLLE